MTHQPPHTPPHRRIRSFVLRQGRLTRRQQQALEHTWPRLGIEFSQQPLEMATLFPRPAPITLEIGFGMGASLVQMAAQQPQHNFIGVEVHTPGIGACLADAADLRLNNLRIIHHDAIDVLRNMIADQTLDRLLLFFPDPWHKARHHKRRIIQADFARLTWQKLRPGGTFHIATDWQPYAEHALTVLSAQPGWRNLSPTRSYHPRPPERPLTKFEQRGQRLGHGVWDLLFQREILQGER